MSGNADTFWAREFAKDCSAAVVAADEDIALLPPLPFKLPFILPPLPFMPFIFIPLFKLLIPFMFTAPRPMFMGESPRAWLARIAWFEKDITAGSEEVENQIGSGLKSSYTVYKPIETALVSVQFWKLGRQWVV